MEFIAEPVELFTEVDSEGLVAPRRVVWRDEGYTVLSVGRQWVDETGRHVLVELARGLRLELTLKREDLVWYATRVWELHPAA